MADVAINVGETGSAPQNYQLTGAQEVVLKSLRASYDGSGAPGSYFPAIQIIAPGGIVVATYTTPSPLAAGASADVTWFQALSAAASAVVAGTSTIVMVTAPSGQVLPGSSNTDINYSTIAYDTSGGAFWNSGTPALFHAPTAGIYLLAAQASLVPSGSGTGYLALQGNGHNGTYAYSYEPPVTPSNLLLHAIGVTDLPAAGAASVLFVNATAGDISVGGAWAQFVKLA